VAACTGVGNGGSCVDFPRTLQKAIAGIQNVDTVIPGHSPMQTPKDLQEYQRFTADIRHRIYLAPNSKVTERFTRVSEHDILYEFKIEEPTAYTQTWRGEIPMHATKGPMYEYACHEGNYSLPGILAGARAEEKTAALAAAGGDK